MDDSPPPPTPFPRTGRLAGIDFGTVRMGIAMCDPSQTWVTPYNIYTRRSQKLDSQYFESLVQQEQLAGWVLGLPIHCDGQESQKSGEVRQFAAWLSKLTGLSVALYDERFTTAEARRLLQETTLSAAKNKKRLDGLAAHLILSHFLDSRRADLVSGPGFQSLISYNASGNLGLEDDMTPPK